MKKILVLLLLATLCFAGTVKIENVPESINPIGQEFLMKFNITCVASAGDPCNEVVNVNYVTDFGLERKGGWEIDTIEKGKRTFEEAGCIFGGPENITRCIYKDAKFSISSNANYPKLKISISIVSDDSTALISKESKLVTVNYAGQQAQQQTQNTDEETQQQTQEQTQTEQQTEEQTQTEVSFFEGIWKWILSLFGINE